MCFRLAGQSLMLNVNKSDCPASLRLHDGYGDGGFWESGKL